MTKAIKMERIIERFGALSAFAVFSSQSPSFLPARHGAEQQCKNAVQDDSYILKTILPFRT